MLGRGTLAGVGLFDGCIDAVDGTGGTPTGEPGTSDTPGATAGGTDTPSGDEVWMDTTGTETPPAGGMLFDREGLVGIVRGAF